ncbi:D-2-hydroxyacid dehydrogenase [Bauldia sp.]|uniref:D-2-hydroxyacid dehydrogenase n=1 Tax=Bauldia sp. TaxID=2575872 RepID=UPI003BABD99E
MNDASAPSTIVFLDRETLPPETRLRVPSFPHRLVAHQRSAPNEVAARIADANIAITNKAPIDAEAIQLASNLKFIAVCATGTDMVDLGACARRGVTVSNVRDYAGTTVPEHVFALIFALRRSLLAYRDSVRDGRWQTSSQFCFLDHPISDLRGSKIGIIGTGALGRAVSRIAEAFGMLVLNAARKGADPEPDRPAFGDVLRQSDILTLHVPLTPETRGLIGREEFALMARRPILINTARGGLVDERALGEALASGRISGAGFDVATEEPPTADHPLMALLEYPNFILTPHVAWASGGAIQALADQTIANIEAYWAGTPRNVVVGGS